MYLPHPNAELTARFREKPYQGAAPESARFLFLGLDANYSADLGEQDVFGNVLAYHEDGVAFWRRHGVHHPFLLQGYRGGGRHYHRSFARIGFLPEHAPEISFAELLHVPTVGRNRLVLGDLDSGHLERLDRAIHAGCGRHVFVPAGVARLMRASGQFSWLPERPMGQSADLGVLHETASGNRVYAHLHFSVYGKHQRRKELEAIAIRALVEPR